MTSRSGSLSPTILILDYGSQYTQLIARRIREQRVYCEIVDCHVTAAKVRELSPRALILSGGPSSVFAEDAPTLDPEILALDLPTLGICYGMQLICQSLGGEVVASNRREYGPATIRVRAAEGILGSFDKDTELAVWMSHGDHVEAIPEGFSALANTESIPFAAIADFTRKIFALQFHPEVAHTPQGTEILRAFLFDVADCEPNWTPSSFVEWCTDAVSRDVKEGQIICGLSGGVDSSVAAVLVHRAVGDQLTCIFVDNGLLRKHEAEGVVHTFRDQMHLKLVHVDASERFLNALKGVTDPEEKRKRIGHAFIEVFDEEAARIGKVDFLVQGTLYPDVIESVSAKGPAAVIKSHHNVGGLPENMKLKLVEPLRELFKDEVREVGATLGMPHDVLWRQPFPGPGLAIRVIGEVTSEKLAILREADAIVDEEIRAAGLYEQIWQSFCVLLPVKTVGVMGDNRTYEYVIAVRAVESRDGMTADWARLPGELLARLSTRIINEVKGCNRVVYDISSKPPATIEWE